MCGLKPSMSQSHKRKNRLQPGTKANCECLLVTDVGDHDPWQPAYVLRTETQGSWWDFLFSFLLSHTDLSAFRTYSLLLIFHNLCLLNIHCLDFNSLAFLLFHHFWAQWVPHGQMVLQCFEFKPSWTNSKTLLSSHLHEKPDNCCHCQCWGKMLQCPNISWRGDTLMVE